MTRDSNTIYNSHPPQLKEVRATVIQLVQKNDIKSYFVGLKFLNVITCRESIVHISQNNVLQFSTRFFFFSSSQTLSYGVTESCPLFVVYRWQYFGESILPCCHSVQFGVVSPT
jgi:hypothetical protein